MKKDLVQDRTVDMGRYKFDEEKHLHTLDGKPLTGVTTALSVIAKPALIAWSANMTADYIKENSLLTGRDADVEGLDSGIYCIAEDVLEDSRKAHSIKKDTAGEFGTKVHNAVEQWIKKGTVPTNLEEMEMKAFDNFVVWAGKNDVDFLDSEICLYSEEMWTGGICDLVIRMNGKIYVADIKTSSGIYKEAFYQCGAYGEMLKERGFYDKFDGFVIINLKKDGKMQVKIEEDVETNVSAFKAALNLYRLINKTK